MLVRELRAFAIVWMPWLLFRMLYFGRWLPNAVLSKSGYHMGLQHPEVYGFLERLLHGEGSTLVIQFAVDHGVQAALLLGAVVFRRVRLPIFIGLVLTLTYGGLITWNGGDWMPNYRLLVACVLPLAVSAAVGLRGFLFHDEQRGF